MRNGYIKNVKIRIKNFSIEGAENSLDILINDVAKAFSNDFKNILKDELKTVLSDKLSLYRKDESVPGYRSESFVMKKDVTIALDLDSEVSAIVERGIIEVSEPIEEKK